MTTTDTTNTPSTRHQTVVHTSTTAAPEPTPAEAALAAALRAVDEARAALAKEQAARARALKVARINARIDRQLERITQQLEALRARADQLQARRISSLAPAETPTPQTATQPATQTQAPQPATSGAQNKPAHAPMRFYQAFVKTYKQTGATQRTVSQACKAHGIDQADRSPENLRRCYEIMVSERTIMVAR